MADSRYFYVFVLKNVPTVQRWAHIFSPE